jgi:UDP-glucose 4-epimerase
MTRVLVTGASGFIGSALAAALVRDGVVVRGVYRRAPPTDAPGESAVVGDLGPNTDWSAALAGVTQVVHLAGPAHGRFGERQLDSAIVDATSALAAQAQHAGVSRFIYVSSIKAAAEMTTAGPIAETTPAAPCDAYGRAKLAAERAVLAHPDLRPVVLRPPLVFAANAGANFARLLKLAGSGVPLPVAGVGNQRSLLSLQSLVNAIHAVLAAPRGEAGVFHLADPPALSTAEIVTALREGMGIAPRLFVGPRALLPRALRQSLEVDDSRFRAAYGSAWSQDARAALVACGAAWKARA